MTIRIIDHKKVDLTDDEYKLYKNICRSYDNDEGTRKGEDLFTDHFETNNEGIIIFVKPPHQRYSSLEVYCFLISIMQNQHMRIIHQQCNLLIEETKKALQKELDELREIKNNLSVES